MIHLVQDASRNYAALLLARVVQQKFPEAKLGLFALTDQGFYYDFDLPSPLPEEDLKMIEREMENLAAEKEPYICRRIPKEEAVPIFEAREESWKVDWLIALPDSEGVLVYEQAGFVDVIDIRHAGDLADPGNLAHLAAPKPLAFKLLNVAGAYWQGDSRNPMLQRVYGVAFESGKELRRYLAAQEEAQKRDHRRLGKQLELFMFAEEAPGMPFYLPKGTVMRQELENLSRGFLQTYEYEEVRTPFIMNRQMWEQSGHWEHYRDNMYFSEIDQHQYAVKPMNCPGHMLLYKNKRRSYKELPVRYAEFGQVHRYEYSGALNGLFRVRSFCQDDAHLFVTPDQMEWEIKRTLQLVQEIYGIFGFEYSLELSTRPADSMGSDEQWEQAEQALAHVLEESGLGYSLNPGDGAFYGPKIDFHIKDALNRSHQCGTIQLDFQMPEKFGLNYYDERNEKQTPIVIHRAVYGSIDRFLGILIEHYGGVFPAWLAPVQVVIIPVAESHANYGEEIHQQLLAAGIRADIDSRSEKLGYRIREAQLQKIPFTLVVGDAEQESGRIQVRTFGEAEQKSLETEAFIASLRKRIEERK
ncbi:threonine--tRNA ligase [Paenibacillus physcomitrellae]|uniref:Threonine--tRNA ligase n=1 Tax=Paenibacillus physcomitrellae TaxID=1619311 RepID=A0ABQ1GEL0_9BACL|nr:threonine--tRNA ligase [Paenibacillus physcomitrellae]GGA42294.1 threonine--tRNA ligase [Paenibacillus physcomitrellae]